MTPQDTPVLVSELYPDKYGVGRTKVYAWLKKLGISTFQKTGDRKSYLMSSQVKRLDQYVEILGKEGPEAAQSFIDSQQPPAPLANVPADTSTGLQVQAEAIPPGIQALAQAIASQIPQTTTDPLAPQRALQEAWREGWHLKNSQLKAHGIYPAHGREIYGFRLSRVKRGWWLVEKP